MPKSTSLHYTLNIWFEHEEENWDAAAHPQIVQVEDNIIGWILGAGLQTTETMQGLHSAEAAKESEFDFKLINDATSIFTVVFKTMRQTNPYDSKMDDSDNDQFTIRIPLSPDTVFGISTNIFTISDLVFEAIDQFKTKATASSAAL